MTALQITHRRQPGTQHCFVTNGGIDSEPDAFYFQFDPDAKTVPRAVVDAVSLVHNTEQTDLSPMAETVETDALTRLLETNGTSVEVSFTYEGLEVTVSNDGDIWLQWSR